MPRFVSLDGPDVVPRVNPNPAAGGTAGVQPFATNQTAYDTPLDVRFLESAKTFELAKARRDAIWNTLSGPDFEVVIYRSSVPPGGPELYLSRQTDLNAGGDQTFAPEERDAKKIGYDLFLVPIELVRSGEPAADEPELNAAVRAVLEFGHGGKPTKVGPR